MFGGIWCGNSVHRYDDISKQRCFSKEGYLTDVYRNWDISRNYYLTIYYYVEIPAAGERHLPPIGVYDEFNVGGIGKLSDKLNELLELRRKEKQHYQEKEALIADTYTNLSHDIRTPLTSLDGYFQLMEECENIEDQKRYLSIIHERIHSLNEMLEELFMFTKLKNESYSLELTLCCMNRILKETVFSYYDEWVRMEIQPDIQITEEQLMKVAEAACAETDTLHNMPFEVTPKKVADAIKAADAYGHYFLGE